MELLDSIYKYRKINPRSVSKFKIAIKMRYIDNEINPIATYLAKRMEILRVSKDPTLTWAQKFDRCWNVIGTDWVIYDENVEPSEEDLLECLRVLIKIKAKWEKIRPLTEPENEYFHKILEPEEEPEVEPSVRTDYEKCELQEKRSPASTHTKRKKKITKKKNLKKPKKMTDWPFPPNTQMEFAPNKKRPGTKSFRRYEQYSQAQTLEEFFDLAGWIGDLKNDTNKGYLKLYRPDGTRIEDMKF